VAGQEGRSGSAATRSGLSEPFPRNRGNRIAVRATASGHGRRLRSYPGRVLDTVTHSVARSTKASPAKRWKGFQLLLLRPGGLEPAAFGFCATGNISHKVKAPRANRPRGLHYLARPTGFEPVAFGFVEDIHVSSNTCKDVQACANTGSVSDEKSKNVQIHASSSKDFAGSLLDGMAADGEDGLSDRSLLSVGQVAKLQGVCPATVYALCGQRKLPHFRVLNAIRIDPKAVKRFLVRVRR
jgi:hypothetical protein